MEGLREYQLRRSCMGEGEVKGRCWVKTGIRTEVTGMRRGGRLNENGSLPRQHLTLPSHGRKDNTYIYLPASALKGGCDDTGLLVFVRAAV